VLADNVNLDPATHDRREIAVSCGWLDAGQLAVRQVARPWAVVDDGKPNMPTRVIIELVGDPAPVTIEQERQPRPGFDATKLVQLVG
jgi:hypothetical protein